MIPWNKNKSVGQKIAERREQLKLTQAELAESLGISQNTVNGYENKNWKNPSAKVIYKLATALSIPTIYLLDDDCQVLNEGDEEVLLSHFRRLPDKEKKLAVEVIKILVETE